MPLKTTSILSVVFLILFTSVLAQVEDFEAELQGGHHQSSPVLAFQPAGDIGGGVLDPGSFFPPENRAVSILSRTSDCLEYRTHTDGLPPGAYTNWWLIANNPENCVAPDELPGSVCGFFDLFFNPEANSAGFWATGGVVEEDGVGQFQARVCMGDDLGFPAMGLSLAQGPEVVDHMSGEVTAAEVIGPQHLWGQLSNPRGALVWLVILYHGPASEDQVTRYIQTHSPRGSCFQGANAYLEFDGTVQCFAPQVSIFNPPAGKAR